MLDCKAAAMDYRTATPDDLPGIVRLLADDDLGRGRELYDDPLPREYRDAFAAMASQEGNEMIVAVDQDDGAAGGAAGKRDAANLESIDSGQRGVRSAGRRLGDV